MAPTCTIPTFSSVPDTNYLTVPTGGCWANPKFQEIIVRTVITKSIVALDCSDSSTINGGLAALIESAILGNSSSIASLTDALNKLVTCIINNGGVITPSTCTPAVYAYVINSDTQLTVASSTPPSDYQPLYQSSIVPTVSSVSSVSSLSSTAVPNIQLSTLLDKASKSGFAEFFNVNLFNPSGGYAYNWVSYASEFGSLCISIPLTTNPIYIQPCANLVPDDDCECDDDTEDGPCSGIESLWCPL